MIDLGPIVFVIFPTNHATVPFCPSKLSPLASTPGLGTFIPKTVSNQINTVCRGSSSDLLCDRGQGASPGLPLREHALPGSRLAANGVVAMAASTSTSDSKQIKVLVRCRPALDHERDHSTESIQVEADSGVIRLSTKHGNTKEFCFDTVFDGGTTQDAVYEKGEFTKTVEAVLRGFNSTVFAYGQTGTGKTFTMEGKAGVQGDGGSGIIPRIIRELYASARAKHGDDVKFSCSFVQIYMEQSYDLLQADMGRLRSARNARPASGRNPKLSSRLKLRWCKEREFYLEGMSVFDCETPEDMLLRFSRGVGNRKIASHRLNMQSSRSHSIFMVNVDAPSADGMAGDRTRSSLMLVDLAGSERVGHTGSGTKKELMRESVFINQSLFALRKVITSLASRRRQAHVPFRDSALTSLLKNSLGGNAFTTMVACLTPSDAFFEENLSTLEYASRASSIVNNMTVKEDPKTKLIRELKQRVRNLEAEVARYRSGAQPAAAMAGPGPVIQTPAPALAAPVSAMAAPRTAPGATDYEELAVETQNVNEALMVENADLREQLRFIQAIVTMEEEDGDVMAPGSAKKDTHTVETAILMELFELRRENEQMREQMQRMEFGGATSRSKAGLGGARPRSRAGKGARPAKKKGMLTVDELRNMFTTGGSSNNVLRSGSVDLGQSLRVTTTGNILDEGEGGGVGEGLDPVEQLGELLAERNALLEGRGPR